MEFKEYENPEQSNYDVKVGLKQPTANPNVDNSLNTDKGIDLNDSYDYTDCALTEEDIMRKRQELEEEKAYYDSCKKEGIDPDDLNDDYSDCAKTL